MATHETELSRCWPSLARDDWKRSAGTLHMWSQIVGKIRLRHTPWVNHSWGTTLYVTSRGLTTSPMAHRTRIFQIDFDFIDHRLRVSTDDGAVRELPLESRTTAEFHDQLFAILRDLDLDVRIHPRPNEVEKAIPFAEDTENATYHPEAVNAFWRALASSDRVFQRFRARFIGKVSPVHFFWGSFDHAVTRFSGRTAPEHPGGFPNLPDRVTREAYSHEVSSAGFWPGDTKADAFYYSYAYPTPEGFSAATVRPDAASWNKDLGEFVLPYEAVRTATDPDAALLEFLETTYVAAADAADWDRASLERKQVPL